MRQILFEWGPMAIPSYGFFVALGFILCLSLAELEGRRRGLRSFLLLDTGIVAFIAGLVGTKFLFFIFANETPGFEKYAGEHGGHSFLAGTFVALLAGVAFLKWRKAPLLQSLDIVFVFVPLGHAVGRIGCLLYGCCYGRVCSERFPLSLRFPAVRDAFGNLVGSPPFREHVGKGLISATAEHSLPVYATQLFAIAACLLLFVLLYTYSRRSTVLNKPGTVVCFYAIGYGFLRLVEEIFRSAPRYGGLITKSQIFAALLLIAGLVGLWKIQRRQAKE